MTPDEFATAYVPLPLAWRHVQAGETFIGKGGKLWHVHESHASTGSWWVCVYRGPTFHARNVDPDEQVQVLTPVPMAQAMTLTKAELGARLIAVRTEGAAA